MYVYYPQWEKYTILIDPYFLCEWIDIGFLIKSVCFKAEIENLLEELNFWLTLYYLLSFLDG